MISIAYGLVIAGMGMHRIEIIVENQIVHKA
jgi:hypothetical protein